VPVTERSLRLDPDAVDSLAHHVLMLELVHRERHAFDIIHYHIDYLHFPLSRRTSVPHVTTLHGRLDLKDLQPLYDEYQDMPVVSISDSQRNRCRRRAGIRRSITACRSISTRPGEAAATTLRSSRDLAREARGPRHRKWRAAARD
jgi:hypothetical protein